MTMTASLGITYFDPAGNYVKVEFSTNTTSSPLVWTEVGECKSVGRNPEASPEIEFTHYASTEQELRLGLPRRGSWDFGCNYAPTNASQESIIGLDASKAERYWRITYPKGVTASSARAYEIWTGFVQQAAIAPPTATENNPADFNFTVRSSGNYQYVKEA